MNCTCDQICIPINILNGFIFVSIMPKRDSRTGIYDLLNRYVQCITIPNQTTYEINNNNKKTISSKKVNMIHIQFCSWYHMLYVFFSVSFCIGLCSLRSAFLCMITLKYVGMNVIGGMPKLFDNIKNEIIFPNFIHVIFFWSDIFCFVSLSNLCFFFVFVFRFVSFVLLSIIILQSF